jgi:membrane protein DedA with SNARE-associated domain
MIATGILINSKFFAFIPAFLLIVAGDLIGDIIWYYIGYFFAAPFLKNYGKFLKITPEMFVKAKDLFTKHHEKILIISKVTIGFGMALATLMAAGASHISFKKYISLNFLGELVLVSILISLGYFFGEIYNKLTDSIKIYFAVGTFITIGTSVFLILRHVKHKIID